MPPAIAALLCTWRHTCTGKGNSLILPDGCQDLVAWQLPGCAPQWKVSNLIDHADQATSQPGMRYWGYRLRPGAVIRTEALLPAVAGLEPEDLPAVLERLDATATHPPGVAEALASLASEGSLRGAQRHLGLSERSLQRLLGQATGRPPSYWRRLARFRRTARALGGLDPLAAVALDHGYADQAHMNLEFNRWLGISPARLQRDPRLMRQFNEPGYG